MHELVATNGSATSGWDVLTALATLGAVLVALYVSVWREHFRRPKLTVTPTRETIKTGVAFTKAESSTHTMLVLAVRNSEGRRTADGLQVLLSVRYPQTIPEGLSGHRLIHQRRLQWWYGDDRIDNPDAVVSESIGPGMSRHVALAMIGHPYAIHKALGWMDDWNEMDDDSRLFWSQHRHGIWAVSPLDREGSGWLKVDSPLDLEITVTGRDVDAVTYRSQIVLRTHDLGPEHHHFTTLNPVFSVFSRWDESPSATTKCKKPNGCDALNWPWQTECWRCGRDLLD